MTLEEFLAARLDEDEAAAKDELRSLAWMIDNKVRPAAEVRSRAEDAVPRLGRVLREVEAKRKILADVIPLIEGMDDQINSEWGTPLTVLDAHLPLLKIMAAVYSDHPDYDPAWG